MQSAPISERPLEFSLELQNWIKKKGSSVSYS